MLHILMSLLIFASSAWSHELPAESVEETPPQTNAHYKPILVIGNDQTSSIYDLVPTVSTLEGDNLVRKRTTSLGETLRNEVGVNSSGYGPTASRPVIRGLEGDRIRILQNGIGVLDASGASQDHAVPVDPLSADSIEIVRGPLTLLYGSSAVGGVVNVTNSRIHDEYTEGFNGAVDVQGSSVNSGKSFAAKTDYGIGGWMLHFDGSFNKTDNVKVPGYTRTPQLRLTDPQTPEPKDKLPNSSSEIAAAAVGATYLSKQGHLGFSFSTFKNNYGVVVEPDTRVDMHQHRFDVERCGYF
jgi:iron complex outermembrane recepter protein